jgi:hypothetical protein
MTKLAFWARRNLWPARLIIIFLIYPLLNLTGWFIGDVLAFNGVHISEAWAYPLSFMILFLFLIYPYKADRKKTYFYTWKKTIDVLMILTSFCFILMRGNNFNSDQNTNSFVNSSFATSSPEKNISLASKSKKEKKNFIKKIVRQFRDQYKKANKRDHGGMIVLAVFVALILFFLLSVLTCSIACSGAEGLAYAIFFVGLGAIIFGLVRVIRRIKLGPKNQPTDPLHKPVKQQPDLG